MRNVIIIILLMLLSGCYEDNSSNHVGYLSSQVHVVNDGDYEEIVEEMIYMEVYSDLDRYQLTMASVPGLPIIVECYPTAEDAGPRLTITCDSGELIRWQDNGVIVVEGDRYHSRYADTVVYWRPIDNDDSGIQATLKFYGYIGKKEEIRTVYVDADGYYLK